MRRKILINPGDRFGRLTAVEYVGERRWRCICDCGGQRTSRADHLASGATRSCNCLRSDAMRKHGWSHTPESAAYSKARERCYKVNDARYHTYGARGIRMCDRWLLGEGGRSGFECFIADMGPRPSAGHSLDRIDSNKDYSPANCRWATEQMQQRNRTNNRIVHAWGEDMPLVAALERAKMTPRSFYLRVNKGWSETRAIEEPKNPGRRGQYGPYSRRAALSP